MARPPSSLPPTGDAPLAVSLILGSFTHDPARFELFNLAVPPSAPVVPHPDATTFALRPEITHTFRPEPKVPPKFISAAFAALVLAPWVVLLGLVCVSPTIAPVVRALILSAVGCCSPKRPPLVQPKHRPFHRLLGRYGGYPALVLVRLASRPSPSVRLPHGDPDRLHGQKCTREHVVCTHRIKVDACTLGVPKYILAHVAVEHLQCTGFHGPLGLQSFESVIHWLW